MSSGADWFDRVLDDLDEEPPEDLLPVGLTDRYRIEGELGRGGAGIVYRAHDLSLDRAVAIKVLHAGISADPTVRRRFLREARAAGRINDPNVLRVYGAEILDDRMILVMEVVEGASLADLLAGGQRSLDERIAILARAARGVGAAHRSGIIHRDLKPANVLVGADGRVRIADFGVARFADSESILTARGMHVGTILYMSPEQVSDRYGDVSPASDVWSFGAMLYEVLTGRPPFGGRSVIEVFERILESDPRPPRERVATVPPSLERVVLAALTREPRRRPSIEEVASVLEDWPDGRTVAPPGEASDRAPSIGIARFLVGLAIGLAVVLVPVLVHVGTRGEGGEQGEVEVAGPAPDPWSMVAPRRPFGPGSGETADGMPSDEELGPLELEEVVLAFDADGRRLLVAGSGPEGWRVDAWDLTTRERRTLRRLEGRPVRVALDPGGRWLLVASEAGRRTVLVDLAGDRERPRPVRGSEAGFTWGGQLLFVSTGDRRGHEGDGHAVLLRDPEAGEGRPRLLYRSARAPRVAYHPATDRLAVIDEGGDGLALWVGRERTALAGAPADLDGLAFDAAGDRLAGLSGGDVWIWATSGGRPTRIAVPGGVRGLAFHPRRPLLATLGEDRRVRFHAVGE